MATIYSQLKLLTPKVVVFGHQEVGLSDLMETLHDGVPVRTRSALLPIATEESPTAGWTFDYRPMRASHLEGYALQIEVYGLASDALNPTHRREVFRNTDAVVFVAHPQSPEQNRRTQEALRRFLEESQLDRGQVPVVACVPAVEGHDPARREAVLQELRDLSPVVQPLPEGLLEAFRQALGRMRRRLEDQLGAPGVCRISTVHREQAITAEERVQVHEEAVLQSGATPILQDTLRDEVFTSETLTWARDGRVPIRILRTSLAGEEVVLDLLCTSPHDTDATRVRLCLRGEEALTPPAPVQRDATITPTSPRVASPQPPGDVPPLWLGLLGTTLGIVAGFLLGYLLFA
ncbi:MAG: hypothetical protein JXX28_00120 [Deltaproteobacteria bacterium]|nr:hypothetical protein [Deltaproteobacteria bacterium]